MKQTEISSIFNLLDKWRLMPSYQLERRADIFFAFYLPQVIEAEYGYNVVKIIPEFPVHKKTLNSSWNDQSFKMDYLVYCKNNKVLFIELKTDTNSINKSQLEYLLSAQKKGISKLCKGVLSIFTKTKQDVKYKRLLNELIDINLLIENNNSFTPTKKEFDIDIIYIQPIRTGHSEDFKTITFRDFANHIELLDSPMSVRFAESLKKWVKNPND